MLSNFSRIYNIIVWRLCVDGAAKVVGSIVVKKCHFSFRISAACSLDFLYGLALETRVLAVW